MERVFYLYFGIVLALLSPALPLSGAILILSIIMIPFFPERSHRDRRITERLIQPTVCPQRVKLLFPACFLIVALGSLLYWLAFFPGGYNLDASGQMLQAHHMLEYSDWHPIFSTLLIQLCTAICDRFEFCILVQILAFALAMAHLLTTLNGYGVPAKLILMMAVFTALNPAIGLNTVSMTKDVQFTGFLVFMMTMLIHIYHTDADWLFRPAHWLCLGLVSACICLVRHNGVLIVIPVLLLLLWRYRSCAKAVVCAAMVCAVCVGIIKGPVSQKLNVEPHDNPVGEMIGIPMAIMANALVYAPEQLPEDVHSFLNTIADDMSWEENYYTGEWDSCKWILPGVDNIKSVPLSQILRYTLKTIVSCPDTSYDSFRENTSIVWQPFIAPEYWIPEVYTEQDEFDIVQRPVPVLHKLAETAVCLSRCFPINMLCWNTGAQIIFIMLCLLHARNERISRAAFLYVPLLVYDFGTMLLLAGPNQRYFYCNAVLYLPVMISILYKRGKT